MKLISCLISRNFPLFLATFQTCEDHFNSGVTVSGLYTIDPDGNGPINPFKAYCDFDSSKSIYYFFLKNILPTIFFQNLQKYSITKVGKKKLIGAILKIAIASTLLITTPWMKLKL